MPLALASTPFARRAAADGGRGGLATTAPPATGAGTRAIIAAASAFLRSRGDAQRAAALFPFAPQGTATAARYRRGQNGAR